MNHGLLFLYVQKVLARTRVLATADVLSHKVSEFIEVGGFSFKVLQSVQSKPASDSSFDSSVHSLTVLTTGLEISNFFLLVGIR